MEPSFAPVLAWVCLALLASDEASERGGYNWESDLKYLYSFHSLIVDTVAVLLVAVVKVVSTSEAIDKVDFTLEVVNLVTGLVEVEIEMLDGHVRSL